MKQLQRFFGSSPLFSTFGRELLTAVLGLVSTFFFLGFFGFIGRVTGIDGLVALGPLGMILVVLLGWVPSTIHVGDDGVLWKWLFWKELVRYRDIREAAAFHNGVELHLHSGKSTRLYSSVFRILMMAFQTEKRDRILAAIREGMEHHRTHRVAEAASLVARAGRSAKDWIDALRGLASSEGGYRSPMLTREVLWRIAEDASVDETARAGAAFALRKDLSADERSRLKDLAGGSVSPKIRVALDAATEEDEVKLEEALRAFDEV